MNSSKPFPYFTVTTSRFYSVAILLIVLALLLRLLFMWTSVTNLPATSDEASVALLAKMIARGEFPLLFTGQPYQFPIEAYMMAPFVEWLPRNAFGARYQTLVLGLLSVFGFLLILRTAFPPGSRWPAVLLVLFPSAYLLMLTSAYAPPQYSMALTLAWVSIYAMLRSRQSAHSFTLLIVAGLSCGSGISNHLLTITISTGVFALIVCCGAASKALRGTLIFGMGCLIGAIPYFLAIWLVPGAYENLPSSIHPTQAILRMIDPAITESLGGAMGFNPVLFPDFRKHIDWPHALRTTFAVFYVLLLSVLLVQRGKKFLLSTVGCHWPKLELVDMALITSLLTFGLVASHRTSDDSYRYLLPAVWCFPFLIGHAFQAFKDCGRVIIGATAIILAIFNFAASGKVILEWSKPGQIENYSDTPRIETLLEKLYEKDITHCYASFWLAYRITFESDENIICALPFNERFLHWPIPYKEQVDEMSDAVYILTQTFNAKLTALNFERHIKSHGITSDKFKVGPFIMYHGFKFPPARGESVLANEKYSLQASNGGDTLLRALNDKDFKTAWISPVKQEKGQWLKVNFDIPKTVTGVTVFHLPEKSNSPNSFKIDGYEIDSGHGEWRPLKGTMESSLERLRFVNNHPVYNGLSQQIRFDSAKIAALRLEIVDPKENSALGFTELEINIINN